MSVRVIEGDCLEVLRAMEAGSVDAVVTDPPWGISLDTDYSRFAGGRKCARRQIHRPIAGDDGGFDPSPWLRFPKVALWGYHCFANRLPMGTVLVWQKKPDQKLGKMMSDCELGWVKGGHGVYLFKHTWDGVCRASEAGQFHHPSQKPVALMEWIIGRLRLPAGATILDPYMGCGSTGVAAVRMGFNFVGIEQDAAYAEIARNRIAEEQSRHPLFAEEPAQ